MARTKKWHVLLCALVIVFAVIVTMFAVTSCKDGDDTTSPDTTPGGTVDPGSLGEYHRTDTSGKPISSTSSSGVVGDLSGYTSVSGILELNGSFYVSDETGCRIYKLSPAGEVQKTYTTDKKVNSVATDGSAIYSLEGGLSGTVVKLTADLAVTSSVTVGHTPSDMAVVNGKGYVTNRFSGTVSVLTLSDMKVSSTVAVDGREPIAIAAAGGNLYVACHLPDEAATEKVMSANVVVISSSNDKVSKTLPLINGASGVKDICASPDGKTVYVAHVIGRYAYPTTQLDRGWINTNGFSIIDTDKQEVTCACLLDEVDLGAANPWGITVSGDGKYLCVALSGLNEVMVVNIAKMNAKIKNVVDKKNNRVVDTVADIADYLPFLDSCRERVKVGVGVRSLFEKDGTLYCGLYFDGAIDAVTLSDLSVKRIKFVDQPEASIVRQGQILWSDANNCYQKWESCNSCHPDAIVDGFNWDNLNDGLGNGKSAKSMLYSHRTPPVMVTGIRANAEIAVAAGMKYIQFNTMDAAKLSYIDEYLKSLYPVASPALNRDGTLTDSAKAGKALFEKNCASCHPAPLYTDLKKHDVGSANRDWEPGNYDTPTLIEVWRTAPYMHDGSLYTLEEVVKFFAKDLNDTEVKNLADFVRSIGAENEAYGVEQVRGKDAAGADTYNVYAKDTTIKTISVRKQSASAPGHVVVALNVYDKSGKQIYYTDCAIGNLAFNSTAVITLSEEIKLPEGGSYSVSIYNAADGKPVASTLTVK